MESASMLEALASPELFDASVPDFAMVSAKPTPSLPTGTAGSYDEWIELLDACRAARGISIENAEAVAGIARQHLAKALSPDRTKTLSPMLLDALLPTLGVRLAVVDDPAASAKTKAQWHSRDESNAAGDRHSWRCSARLLSRARPWILDEVAADLAAKADAGRGKRRKSRREIRRLMKQARPYVLDEIVAQLTSMAVAARAEMKPPRNMPAPRARVLPAPKPQSKPAKVTEADRRANLRIEDLRERAKAYAA